VSAADAEPGTAVDRDQVSVTIVLNATSYTVPAGTMTVRKLRALPFPPIPSEYDLWLEGSSGGPDTFLRDDDEIQVREGTRVFAAPRTIVAGCTSDGRH
jgi:hypothetical protein